MGTGDPGGADVVLCELETYTLQLGEGFIASRAEARQGEARLN